MPYIALVPIGVTVENMADTVIADEFRTIEEICTGEVAQTHVLPRELVTSSAGGRRRPDGGNMGRG